ncbi:unnamed protein product [Sympodiomycopsis kandeliae]
MSNSSPSDVTPPDLATSGPRDLTANNASNRSFAFVQGDDAEYHEWQQRIANQRSAQNPALMRLSQEDAITQSDMTATNTTQTSGSSGYATRSTGSIPGEKHQMPIVASQTVPLHGDGLERVTSSDSDQIDEKDQESSKADAQEQVAIDLTLAHDQEANKKNAAKGVQEIFLPSQDLQMKVTFLHKRQFNYILFIIGSVLTVGLLPLIAAYWAPKLYKKWCYRAREFPQEQELQGNKPIHCLIKVASEPASIYKLKAVDLPHAVPASRIFAPTLRVPFTSAYHAANGTQDTLTKDSATGDAALSSVRILNFRHTSFIYHTSSRKLVALADWKDASLGSDAPSPLTAEEIAFRRTLFGDNIIDVKGKPLWYLIISECLHPFYVFTLASCALWFYDTYQVYGAVVLAISILGVSATVIQTRKAQTRMRKMSRYEVEVEVERQTAGEKATWQKISSADVVPGDIISISSLVSQNLPADMILLDNANCIANESMLTGESVPSSKTPILDSDLQAVMTGEKSFEDIEKNLLWGGTILMRAHKDSEANDAGEQQEGAIPRVRAMVITTGWASTKGSLVKMMLFPSPIKFKFYSDAFMFIGILSTIAIIGFIGSVINFVNIGVAGDEIGLRTIDLFTICVPPALPAAMSICVTFALSRLKKSSIYCISPQRLNVAGKISIAVFDKTGTLTETGLDVRGVRIPQEVTNSTGNGSNCRLGEFAESIETLNEADKAVTMEEAMAVAHDVTLIDDERMGDPLEVSMLGFTKWTFEEKERTLTFDETVAPSGVAKGKAQCMTSPDGTRTLALLRKFDFSPVLRRMSVLTQSNQGDDKVSTVYVKGAPESLVPLCDPTTIPDDFDQILNDATRKGLRVLAFGYKKVSLSLSATHRVPRDFVESDLKFMGLLFFENKLKPSTSGVIADLHEADIPTKMCTGDAVNTAIAVAREAGIIPSGQPVFVPRLPTKHRNLASTRTTDLIWKDIDLPIGEESGAETALDPYSLSPKDPSLSLSTVGLALTGDVFQHLLAHASQETLARLLVRAQVFARFSPELKAELVWRLQQIGHSVAFTGDGANDTGALKGADVGLSLSEAEASIAAPFTSADDRIDALVTLIKEGRNCLATSTSLFLYFGVYAICEYYSVILLYGQATSFSNADYLYIDIFWVFSIGIAMAFGKPAMKLSKSRPFSRLMTRRIILSFIGPIIFLTLAQATPYIVLHKQSWYEKPEVDAEDLELNSYDTTVVAKTSFWTLAIAAIAWNMGPPHRLPLYKNWLLSFAIVTLTTLNLAILFSNDPDSNGLSILFGFFKLPTSFLFIIFGTILIQALCSFVWEFILVDYFTKKLQSLSRSFKRWKSRKPAKTENGAEVDSSAEKKYRQVERALKLEESQRAKMKSQVQ